jgi:hypothetical protein
METMQGSRSNGSQQTRISTLSGAGIFLVPKILSMPFIAEHTEMCVEVDMDMNDAHVGILSKS